ncbi:MAG TPA: hypothetical protein VGC57_16680 [Cellulomonas sp.]
MTVLRAEPETLDDAGERIVAAARSMPDPRWGPACDCGETAVDAELDRLTSTVVEELLGAAAEMFRLGQSMRDAAQHLAETDARLAEVVS